MNVYLSVCLSDWLSVLSMGPASGLSRLMFSHTLIPHKRLPPPKNNFSSMCSGVGTSAPGSPRTHCFLLEVFCLAFKALGIFLFTSLDKKISRLVIALKMHTVIHFHFYWLTPPLHQPKKTSLRVMQGRHIYRYEFICVGMPFSQEYYTPFLIIIVWKAVAVLMALEKVGSSSPHLQMICWFMPKISGRMDKWRRTIARTFDTLTY